MDGRPTWTDCDEAGDNIVPNVLSPRDLVFRPDNMDETVPHTDDKKISEQPAQYLLICTFDDLKHFLYSEFYQVATHILFALFNLLT